MISGNTKWLSFPLEGHTKSWARWGSQKSLSDNKDRLKLAYRQCNLWFRIGAGDLHWTTLTPYEFWKKDTHIFWIDAVIVDYALLPYILLIKQLLIIWLLIFCNFYRQEHIKLQEKLKAVESKIIVGGVNLVCKLNLIDNI